MKVGFTVLVRDDQVEIQFIGRRPEDPRSLVAHAQSGAQHAVLMGRLTCRSELLAELKEELPSASDVALALAAYRRWGRQGLELLEGTFALVVWDGDRRVLLGSRDPLGGYPLFWARHERALAFSTSMAPLLRFASRPSLDQEYLAELLACDNGAYQEVPTPHTAYEGIRRLSPGAIAQASCADGEVEQQTYWDWLERQIDPGTTRMDELADLVATSLRRAVAVQLRGRVAAHFSGGMDSTSVALLAREWLQNAPGQPPLHAISLVYDKMGGLSSETPYIECALRQPGLVSHRLAGDQFHSFDRFFDITPHDEPTGLIPRLGTAIAMVDAAAGLGADTLLTGIGGDGLTDQQQPAHLADLLRRGRLWSAWSEARRWARADNFSATSYLWKHGVVPLLPASWQRRLDRHGPAATTPWVRPDFARAHSLSDRVLRHLKPLGRSEQTAQVLGIVRRMSGDCTRWIWAAPHGMAYTHPFLDVRFISLCLGIQSRYRQDPGRQKPLLAHAMRDVLPEPIRNRRSKIHYGAGVHAGLVRWLPRLEAFIRGSGAEELGVFDIDILIQCLRQAAMGHVPGGLGCRLDTTLSWLRWYSSHKEWHQPSPPAAVIRVSGIAREAVPAA
jgi:asparagine synthase (glutamine-hydrolysing)